MTDQDLVKAQLADHIDALQNTLTREPAFIRDLAATLVTAFRAGRKLLLIGNGGSAADAQHIAAEFVNRFSYDRPALPALALTTDTSVLTCISNDSAYEFVFARQIEAFAAPGDVVIAISTSGRSANVVKALEACAGRGVIRVGLTGQSGGEFMAPRCDLCLAVRSTDTARIQEVHEFVLHVVVGLVEREMFPRGVSLQRRLGRERGESSLKRINQLNRACYW